MTVARRRVGTVVALGVVAFVASAVHAQTTPVPTPPVAPPRADWARFVPADARLYVEFRDLSVTRHHLRRVGIWDTIRSLGLADDGPPSNSTPWQRRTEQLLGMPAEQVVVRILGLRTAMFAVDPWAWERSLVLAELGDDSLIPALLRMWKALPTHAVGEVRCFQLPGGLVLAVKGRTLLFGPESDEQSLWTRTVLLMAGRGGASLAAVPTFEEMRASLPAEFDGLFYVGWRDGTPDADTLPNAALMATMEVSAADLAFEVRGRGIRAAAPRIATTQPIAERLPADSLAVWSGALDATRLVPDATAADDGRQYSLAATLTRALLQLEAFGRQAVSSTRGAAALVVGRRPASDPDDFDQPEMTFVLETRKPGEAAIALDAVIALASFSLPRAADAPDDASASPIETRTDVAGDLEIRQAFLGKYLAKRTRCPFFARVNICWAAADQWLLISTSREHLVRVANSLRRKELGLGGDPRLASLLPRDTATSEWTLLRGEATATMMRSWLRYLERRQPSALTPQFWADWARQRLARQGRLGVGLRNSPDQPSSAIVVEVAPDSPAAGQLRAGDTIVAVNSRPLLTTQPAREVAERFEASRGAAGLTFTVRRGDKTLPVVVPLAPPVIADPDTFDPVSSVRALIGITEHIETVTLWSRRGPQASVNAKMLVRWRSPTPKSTGKK